MATARIRGRGMIIVFPALRMAGAKRDRFHRRETRDRLFLPVLGPRRERAEIALVEPRPRLFGKDARNAFAVKIDQLPVLLIKTGVSLDVGGILLMALGAQWYVLFNVIAGASAIPADLREASVNLGVSRWLRWKRMILPAVFASWVTGGITAPYG